METIILLKFDVDVERLRKIKMVQDTDDDVKAKLRACIAGCIGDLIDNRSYIKLIASSVGKITKDSNIIEIDMSDKVIKPPLSPPPPEYLSNN
jgi:hypothetical protein